MVKWNVETCSSLPDPAFSVHLAIQKGVRFGVPGQEASEPTHVLVYTAPAAPTHLTLAYFLLKLLLTSSYMSWHKSWSPSTNTDLYVLRYCYIEDDLKLQSGESVIINVIFCLLKQRERYHSKDNPKFWIHFITNTNITDHNKKRLCKGRINPENLLKEG